jgi:hypothetical protein
MIIVCATLDEERSGSLPNQTLTKAKTNKRNDGAKGRCFHFKDQ